MQAPHHQIPETPGISIHSVTTKHHQRSYKESLLRKDPDGRWCRHIFPANSIQPCITSLQRVCAIFSVESVGDSVVKSIRSYMQAAENFRESKAREKEAEAGLNAAKENVRAMCLRYTGLQRIGKLGSVTEESLRNYGLQQEDDSDDEGGQEVDVKGMDPAALQAGVYVCMHVYICMYACVIRG